MVPASRGPPLSPHMGVNRAACRWRYTSRALVAHYPCALRDLVGISPSHAESRTLWSRLPLVSRAEATRFQYARGMQPDRRAEPGFCGPPSSAASFSDGVIPTASTHLIFNGCPCPVPCRLFLRVERLLIGDTRNDTG